MKYQVINGIPQRASTLCLGTMFMGMIPKAESDALLDRYVEAGGNFLDTAKIYSDWCCDVPSVSEKGIGQWMADRGNREKIIIGTKGAHHDMATGQKRLGRRDIMSDLEASLRHLHTDYIDLYWLHRDDPDTPVEGVMETLDLCRQSGKILAYGCSNWTTPRIAEAQRVARQNAWLSFVANQPMFGPARINEEAMPDKSLVGMSEALLESHRRSKLVCIPYSSQAGGLFQKIHSGTRDLGAFRGGVYGHPDNPRRFQAMQEVAKCRSWTMTQVVLAYMQAQIFPTLPIVGPHTLDQLNDCLSGADLRLSTAERDAIDGLAAG